VITFVPMIAGLGEVPGPPEESLMDALGRDLDMTEALVNLGATTAGEVRGMLVRTQTYLLRAPTVAGQESDRAASLSELEQRIAELGQYDQAASSPPDLWPPERRAIERAYQWAEGNGAQLQVDAGEAQARADALGRILGGAGQDASIFGQGLERTLQDAVKWLAIGVLVIGGVMVLPSLVGGLSSLRGSR
jgi:hypothetical protein